MVDKEGKMHPRIADAKPFEGSGKDVSAPNPPIVSVAPMSGNPGQNDSDTDPVYFDDAEDAFLSGGISEGDQDLYGIGDLDYTQSVFVEPKNGNTVDKLLVKINKNLAAVRNKYSVIELDEKGDEIWLQCTVKTKKRNDDGTVQLSESKPVEGASFTHIPKRIYLRNYVAVAVTKDQEFGDDSAPADGVLIMRV